MAGSGDSPLWISRDQSSVLRGTYGTTAGKRFAVTQTGDLPSWKRLFPCGDPRRPERRYDDGLYASGRADDGYTIRFSRPWHPYLFNAARSAHRAATRRRAEHPIRSAGNLWNLGRHAAD